MTLCSVSISSVTQSCPTLCGPMDCSTARLPYPSPTPGAYSNSCPSSLVMPSNHLILCCPLSSHLQFFPASGSFPVSRFFASSGQSIGASASVLPMNIQDLFPLGWTGWLSWLSKGLSLSSPTPQFKSISSLALSLLHSPTLTSIHDHRN